VKREIQEPMENLEFQGNLESQGKLAKREKLDLLELMDQRLIKYFLNYKEMIFKLVTSSFRVSLGAPVCLVYWVNLEHQ